MDVTTEFPYCSAVSRNYGGKTRDCYVQVKQEKPNSVPVPDPDFFISILLQLIPNIGRAFFEP